MAQDKFALPGDSLYTTLKDLEVTAERNHLATVQELSGKQLQTLSSSSIADALKYFAGVQIKDYGGLGGLKTINVRSLGAQHVGVYLDGIKITNAQNGTVDLGKFSLSSLESVSLYNANKLEKGMSASEYASGATVYLRTRRPVSDSISILGGIGSFNYYRGRINLQFCRKNYSGFIDGEYLYSKGDYPFRYHSEYEDTVGRRKNSDIKFYRIESAFFNRGFSGHLYAYISERGIPGGVVRRLSDRYTNVGREWDSDIFAQLSWQNSFSRQHFFRVNTKYSYEYLRYNTDYPENQNTAKADNHYFLNDSFLSLAYTYSPWQWLYANLSVDSRLSWLKSDLRNFSTVRRHDLKSVVNLQGSWRGLKADLSLLFQYYQDHTKMYAGAASPIKKFTPSFILGYSWKELTFRVWYKKIFRVPTLNDLYYTQAGNRNLKPEYTRQFNLGAEYTLSKKNWIVATQIDAYLNHIDNRIVCLPLRGTYTWTMMNYGKTFCRGLNANFNMRYYPSLWFFSLLGSITLQNDINKTDPTNPDSYKMPICYSPKFSSGITAIVGWKNISISVSDIYVSKRIWSYADIEDTLPDYNNVDIKVSAQWKWLNASLEVMDVFDVQYEHVPRYPMPGRTFRFSLSYALGKTKHNIK